VCVCVCARTSEGAQEVDACDKNERGKTIIMKVHRLLQAPATWKEAAISSACCVVCAVVSCVVADVSRVCVSLTCVVEAGAVRGEGRDNCSACSRAHRTCANDHAGRSGEPHALRERHGCRRTAEKDARVDTFRSLHFRAQKVSNPFIYFLF
jgi:hypothetical protein